MLPAVLYSPAFQSQEAGQYIRNATIIFNASVKSGISIIKLSQARRNKSMMVKM